MHRLGLVVAGFLLLAACGGTTGSRVNDNAAGPGSPPGQIEIVPVSAGRTSTGINVTVASPAASPAPNAEVLGVGRSASNTGAQIQAGTGGTVFLCGPGLSGNMQVRISGPGDISPLNVRGVECTDSNNNKVPGIQFDVNVPSGAAPGGRTVLLISPQNDITTFTGGLEVVPCSGFCS